MKYINLALSIAEGNPIENLPRMAALLVTKGGRTYVGFNKRKSHPLQKLFGRNSDSIYLHAEIDAIINASRMEKGLEGSTLYVARVKRNGEKGLAKPCLGCSRAIEHFGIKDVKWT